jgi:predicted Zn-dependent protease
MKRARGFLWGFLLFALSCSLCAQSDALAGKSERARELLKAGRFEEAIPFYRDLVRAEPGNPSFAMNLGLALHMVGSERQAIEQFEAVLKLDPSYSPAQLFLGEAYLTLGEPAKAMRPLEKAIQAQPANPDAREMVAEAFFSLQQFEQAAEHFHKLTGLAPGNPRAWNGLRRTCEILSSRALEELAKIAPDSAYWMALMGDLRSTQRQYGQAFYFYRKALARVPTLRGVHSAVAEIYRKTGHADWAAIEEKKERKLPPLDCIDVEAPLSTFGEPWKETASLPPSDQLYSRHGLECGFWKGRYRLVVALAKDVKTDESYYWQARAYSALALQTLTHLADMKPSPELHQVMAKIYLDRKEYLKSAREWQEALKSAPGDPRIQKALAVSLKLSGSVDKARAILQDLLKREPNSAELSYLLGDTLLSSLQTEEAIGYLRKAVDLDPALLPAHRALARAYRRVGKSDLAIPHLKAALPVDSDGSLYYQLAQAFRKTGQRQLEREMLTKFQEIKNSASLETKAHEGKTEITPP